MTYHINSHQFMDLFLYDMFVVKAFFFTLGHFWFEKNTCSTYVNMPNKLDKLLGEIKINIIEADFLLQQRILHVRIYRENNEEYSSTTLLIFKVE